MKVISYQLSVISLCATGAMISFVLFIFSFVVQARLALPLARQAQAQTMSNDKYKIQAGTFNSFSGKATGTGGKITFTGSQSAVGLYSGTNYKVRAGFQYINSTIPFTFSISTTEINFGILRPGEPITRTHTLTVSAGAANGYQVTLAETYPLRVSPSVEIPDTTCDNGTCSQTSAAVWTSPLTYGFGYRCDNVSGSDCSKDFASSAFYKQFPSLEKNETAQVFMSSATSNKRQTQVTYKVNIPATQIPGNYQNIIKYIATPTI